MAGGDFSTIDFAAAAPYTYNLNTGGGAYNDRTVGNYKDITEQLQGGQFAFGNIVTYLVQIEVAKNAVDPVQFAEFDFGFLADSTGQSGAAQIDIVNVAVNYGNVENGDNGTDSNGGKGVYGLDSGIYDDYQGNTALDKNGILGSTAILVPGSEKIVDPKSGLEVAPYTKGSQLQGTVRISDLEAGEKIVVRIDVLLANLAASNPTGNLQGELLGGRVVDANGNFLDKINTGQQTIPFLKIGQIANVSSPALNVVKTADKSQVDWAGQVITYTYTVTNTGNVSLSGINLVDDNFTATDTSDDLVLSATQKSVNGDDVLDVGETWTYSYQYAVTQNDLDKGGQLVNIATASSTQAATKQDSETVEILQKPDLAVVQAADKSQVDWAGQVITYTYTVTNTGNISLSGINLVDDNFTATDTSDDLVLSATQKSVNGDDVLDVGETWTYSYQYAVTQHDLDKGGQLVNIATASSTQAATKQDSETVEILQKPDLAVVQAADKSQVDWAGQVITYTYTVTNTGNVSLSGINLVDDNFTTTDISDDLVLSATQKSVNGDDVLDVGETWTYSYQYAVTQNDLDKGGQLVNIATASSTQAATKQDSETVQIIQKPDLAVVKTADKSQVDWAGQVITYTYTVTNTGNISLSGINLVDDNFTATDTSDDLVLSATQKSVNGDDVLDVGETWTYTYQYAVTQNDLDKGGQLVNIATASSTQSAAKQDSETVEIIQKPSIEIDKITTDGLVKGDNVGITAGQAINWVYVVKNTGNVSLSNISVTDDKVQQELIKLVNNGDGDTILAPNETWIYKADGIAITGNYQNLGTVSGDYSGGQITDNDTSSYLGIQAPGVRTPGFWINWTQVWDGNAANDTEFAGRSNFPMSDILLQPYSASSNAPNVIDPVTGKSSVGILIGDYNRNGITDNGERTIFYSLDEAKTILAASNKVQEDKRYTLDRSLVASWLNYLAFNPAPIKDINDGIAWIQTHTADENQDAIGDGSLVVGASTYKLNASSPFWNVAAPLANLSSGQSINTALDNYNNFGLS
ncbi:DUF7507 domain-containing protein [Gloeothece verrucosa]|uniref:DUF7507 domain-containing protein n=1 Tax=Gloeothece verrucosa (strain PCC 7822) TaxID=497965 RepID=E0UEA8_GLOV7|nr:DUF11 domain-containing protein [Gloeothece verrucosa]ADN14233.1 hypothetical protein Cyan7822_2255 [Gloeothece verrucosa PCC 7822]